ncbi:MAG: hypothetical protein DI626_05300 [Micavibrio aeruginosavorus]|uniref:Uncharacterized protein n=1 Tax=Micavibrio aeruginosavorus TaxID=349221 RepID=A0A2W4ZX69_9BACT|nr:MAG: hypothetical protein DI626_05300 [Micavibrio aeruginosavorus]
MVDCKGALVAYFKQHLPALHKEYEWRIPVIDGLRYGGKTDYHSTVGFKKDLTEKWEKADLAARYALAVTIVSSWGGVRGNRAETIEAYVNELAAGIPRTPLKGVASYSKIFSISNPDTYAIYDARVAACLVAIQYNANVRNGIAFNYIAGRNNTTGNTQTRKGFVYEAPFKKTALLDKGWTDVERDKTYETYLDLMTSCLAHFPENKLYDLEMVLFSRAVTECAEAMRRMI